MCNEDPYAAIKHRINLQAIGNFIREGGEEKMERRSFRAREARAFDRLERRVAQLCPPENKNEILDSAFTYAAVIEEIYFNLGVKAGALLQRKLMDHFETDV